MRLERRHQPLLPPAEFRGRVLRYAAVAFSVIGTSLGIGIAGYHWLAGLPWLDALVNAAMILGGMGPVDPVTSTPGKWFAAAYALYSGIALLTSVGLLFAPVVHRVLHHFHLEQGGDSGG